MEKAAQKLALGQRSWCLTVADLDFESVDDIASEVDEASHPGQYVAQMLNCKRRPPANRMMLGWIMNQDPGVTYHPVSVGDRGYNGQSRVGMGNLDDIDWEKRVLVKQGGGIPQKCRGRISDE